MVLQSFALKPCLFGSTTEENWRELTVRCWPIFLHDKAALLRSLQTAFLLRCCERDLLLENPLRPQYLHWNEELICCYNNKQVLFLRLIFLCKVLIFHCWRISRKHYFGSPITMQTKSCNWLVGVVKPMILDNKFQLLSHKLRLVSPN